MSDSYMLAVILLIAGVAVTLIALAGMAIASWQMSRDEEHHDWT